MIHKLSSLRINVWSRS